MEKRTTTKKIAFLGSKPVGFECLKYLIEQSEKLNIDIVAVLTKKNILDKSLTEDKSENKKTESRTIADLCQIHKIKILDDLDDLLALSEIDILISVQYHKILKARHIKKVKEVAVNLHMAPLPEYRGCNQFSFAILDEKTEFGTTIHVLDESIDAGDILFETRFPIPNDIFVSELYAMTRFHSINLFKSSIENLVNGEYMGTPQSKLIKRRGVSYHYRKEIENIKKIRLEWPKEKIKKHIRATYFPPFSPPYFIINGKRFNITSTEYINE